MLKKKFLCLLIIMVLLYVLIDGTKTANAMVPYETYTYDNFGVYYVSPNAYEPSAVIDEERLGLGEGKLKDPKDIVTDKDLNVYIADTGNNRIVILDRNYQLKRIIKGFINESGEEETFNEPAGIYVTEDGILYVADSKNYRIVVLDKEGALQSIIGAPSSEVLPKGFIYEPSALAVDPAGRIYVISKSTNMGVIALESDGSFSGFVGAEKVAPKITELFWKIFTTKEQKQRSNKNVPTEYNNITIDEKGFVYVTTSAIKGGDQFNAMITNDGTSKFAPIKKLNPAGIDVLRRNGTFAPAGDIQAKTDVSRFVDAALGDDGVYSVLDSTRNRVFTYDINGNLLYVFGGYGTQTGVFQNSVSISYHDSDILVLDAITGMITVFSRTEYGDSIATALHLQNNRKYDQAAKQWKYILTLNSSFDQAYTGVASSYMRLEKYKDAMDYYKTANNYLGYQKAYTEYRKVILQKYSILVPVGFITILIFLLKILGYVKKVNSVGWKKKGRRTIKQELCYSYYTMFHPFDGFYDLKHENRGGIRGAIIILLLALFNHLFRQIAGGYIFFGSDWRTVSLIDAFMTIGLPLALWVVSNWALTTLMDGKGTMKDIFIASSYALMPMILLGIPTTLLSNIVTTNEFQFITFLNMLGLGWSLFLIFFGVLTTNQYSLGKNTATTAFSVISMGFIAFIGILFINVIQKMWDFVSTIVSEILFRI